MANLPANSSQDIQADPLRDYIIEDSSEKRVYKFPKGMKYIPDPITLLEMYAHVKYNQNPITGETSTIICYKYPNHNEKPSRTFREDESLPGPSSDQEGSRALEPGLSPGPAVKALKASGLDDRMEDLQGERAPEDQDPNEDNYPIGRG